MSRSFSRNSHIGTSSLPLPAMSLKPTVRMTFVGDQMSQFMKNGSPDFLLGNLDQSGVQLNQAIGPDGATRGRPHPWIPFHQNPLSQIIESESSEAPLAKVPELLVQANRAHHDLPFFPGVHFRFLVLIEKTKAHLPVRAKHAADYFRFLNLFKFRNKFLLSPTPSPLSLPPCPSSISLRFSSSSP